MENLKTILKTYSDGSETPKILRLITPCQFTQSSINNHQVGTKQTHTDAAKPISIPLPAFPAIILR
jgi:hypothetical protein